MKKVLHIVGGMDVGGTETMIMNLYRRLHNEVQFDFISYYDKEAYYDREIQSLGGKVIRVDPPSKVGQVKAIKNLVGIIKKENYEVVHAHTLFNCGIAMIAARLCGANVRVSHAHTNLDLGSNRIKKIYFSLMRIIIKVFSTDFLACSNSAGEYLFKGKIMKESNYNVLPNYINYKGLLECNNYENIRVEFGIKEKDILIGHIGRFVEAKNHKFLIKVLKRMIDKNRNIKAILVGDGNLKCVIEEQVKRFKLEKNIFFLGLRDDIDSILNNCDIFIFPSIYEGLGLVMLEAQACGLPCLVSEAIQPEADLNLGLIKQINLSDGVEAWSEEALKLIGKKHKNIKVIEEAFINKGYDIDNIINTLKSVYKIS